MSDEYLPNGDFLFSKPHHDNPNGCSCCLSETCRLQDKPADVAVMSSSFALAAGLHEDTTSFQAETEPMDTFEFANPGKILDHDTGELNNLDVTTQVRIENATFFEKDELVEVEPGIKELKMITLFKRRDPSPKPLAKPDAGERRRYERYREKKYVCDICDRSFTLKQNIATHFYQYHHPRIASKNRMPMQVVSKFFCTTCERVFTDFEKAKRHEQKAHSGLPKKVIHQCDRCDKIFPSPHALLEHTTVVHDQLKPFACDLCDQTFGRQGGLRRHQLMVHENKTVQCPYEDCEHPGYKCSKALTAHILSKHTHERPYGCLYCEKRFVRRNDLRVHEMTHSDVALFHCDHCGTEFKRQAYLRKHKMHCGVEMKAIKRKAHKGSNKSKKTIKSEPF